MDSLVNPSPLLRLPAELRLEIYAHIHQLSTPTYPHFHAPYIPLLLTCRAIHSELAPLLPGWINYSFSNPAAMIGYFSALGEERWRKIRYLTLGGKASGKGNEMRLWMRTAVGKRGSEGEGEEPQSIDLGMTYFGVSSVMKLWQGLRLEKLVIKFHEAGGWFRKGWQVEASRDGFDVQWEESLMFQEVDALLAEGKGWREAELITPNVKYSSATAGKNLALRRRHLRERDEKGIVEDFVFDDQSGATLEIEEAWEFEGEMKVYESDILTRIRRGEGVDYTQDCQTDDIFDRELLEIFKSRSWKQIREEGLYEQCWD